MSARVRGVVRSARRFWDEVTEAGLQEAAGAVAFSLMLAILPALIFLAALAAFIGQIVGITNLFSGILSLLGSALPGSALQAIMDPLLEVLSTRSSGLLSIGVLFTLWAASNGTAAMMRGFNRAHGVLETRPFWLHRIVIAVGLTVLLGTLLLAVFIVLVFGQALTSLAVRFLALDPGLADLWNVLVWPASALALVLALDILYWLGPSVSLRFRLFTPGAIVATAGWLVFSFGFSLFVELFGRFPATYGAIAGVIVLMLWLNYSSLVVILGAKLNVFLTAGTAPPPLPAAPPPATAPPAALPPVAAPVTRARGLGKYVAVVLGLWTMAILVGAWRGRGGPSAPG